MESLEMRGQRPRIDLDHSADFIFRLEFRPEPEGNYGAAPQEDFLNDAVMPKGRFH